MNHIINISIPSIRFNPNNISNQKECVGINSFSNPNRYSVMAGTPQKMLDYLLEARMDSKLEDVQGSNYFLICLSSNDVYLRRPPGRADDWIFNASFADSFIEDFLLTHITFMPSQQLCSELIRQYPFIFFLTCHTEFRFLDLSNVLRCRLLRNEENGFSGWLQRPNLIYCIPHCWFCMSVHGLIPLGNLK